MMFVISECLPYHILTSSQTPSTLRTSCKAEPPFCMRFVRIISCMATFFLQVIGVECDWALYLLPAYIYSHSKQQGYLSMPKSQKRTQHSLYYLGLLGPILFPQTLTLDRELLNLTPPSHLEFRCSQFLQLNVLVLHPSKKYRKKKCVPPCPPLS